MRTLLCVCLLIGSCITLDGQQPQADPYSLAEVRNAIDGLSVGIIFGGDAKLIPRLGDRCSIAILKVVNRNDLTDSKKVAVIVQLIHNSFALPENITADEDRDSRVSLFLLEYLLEKVGDTKVQQQIRQTIEFVKEQTKANLPAAGRKP
jgi:hypothetical protein